MYVAGENTRDRLDSGKRIKYFTAKAEEMVEDIYNWFGFAAVNQIVPSKPKMNSTGHIGGKTPAKKGNNSAPGDSNSNNRYTSPREGEKE